MSTRQHAPVLLAFAVLTTAANAQPAFFGLGTAPGAASYVNAVSPDGSTAVGWRADGGGPSPPGQAFRWTLGTGRVTLPPAPDFTSSVARDVSGGGQYIVGYVSGPHTAFAARWGSSGEPQILGALPGHVSSLANGISQDGSVVVGLSNFTVQGSARAFRWTSAGMQDLGVLPGYATSSAAAVTPDGSVIVGSNQTSDLITHAFRWTSAGMVDLGVAPTASSSTASATSADGSIIVGSSGGYAARWTAATGMQTLFTGAALNSSAHAITSSGSLIGGTYFHAGIGQSRAVLWNSSGTSIDFMWQVVGAALPSGWLLTQVTGISDDGQTFVGQGVHNGVNEGWVVMVPAPSTGTLALAFGALVIKRPRRLTRTQPQTC